MGALILSRECFALLDSKMAFSHVRTIEGMQQGSEKRGGNLSFSGNGLVGRVL